MQEYCAAMTDIHSNPKNPKATVPEDNSAGLFSNFVMSLVSATLVELGLVQDPIAKEFRKSPDHARQNIEILNMISQKTKGNLNPDEKALIDRALTDLKFEFAKSQQASKA